MIDINDLSAYHADRMIWDEGPATVTVCKDWPRAALMPVVEGNYKTFKPIAVKVWIDADTEEQAELDISNFSLAICDNVIKRGDYYYHCTLDGKIDIAHEGFAFYVLGFNLQSDYKSKAEVTSSAFSNSAIINAEGNLPSPAIITLTPSADIPSLTVSGLTDFPMTIKNLHAGAPVVIDGKGVVTEADYDTVLTPDMGANNWLFRKYNGVSVLTPEHGTIYVAPELSHIAKMLYTQALVADATDIYHNKGGNTYYGHWKTAIKISEGGKTVTFCFKHDDGCNVLIDGASVFKTDVFGDDDPGYPKANFTVTLDEGWHRIDVLIVQGYGDDGFWDITPTISSQGTINCYYARDTFAAGEGGNVNKFPETDIFDWPKVLPGANTVTISDSRVSATLSYKPKYM